MWPTNKGFVAHTKRLTANEDRLTANEDRLDANEDGLDANEDGLKAKNMSPQIAKSLLFFIMVLCGFLTSDALAQELMSGRWWNNDRVVKRLGLTSDEISSLENAYRETRRNLISLKGKVEVEQFELETLLEAPQMDESAAKDQYQRLETARTALGSERFEFLLDVRRIVGFERLQKLMQIRRVARQQQKKK